MDLPRLGEGNGVGVTANHYRPIITRGATRSTRSHHPTGINPLAGEALLRITGNPCPACLASAVRTPGPSSLAFPRERYPHPCRLGHTVYRPPSPRRSLHFAIFPTGKKGNFEKTLRMGRLCRRGPGRVRHRSVKFRPRLRRCVGPGGSVPVGLAGGAGVAACPADRNVCPTRSQPLPGFPPAGRPRIATHSR